MNRCGRNQITMFAIRFDCVVILVLAIYVHVIVSRNDSKDLVLTLAEKNALDAFKSLVIKSLPEEFMKTDFYLVRWIRVAKLDVNAAKNLLFQALKWRVDFNVSGLLKEDWSDLDQDFPMALPEGQDKEGRPVLSVELGDWDLRSAVLRGIQRRLGNYLIYAVESGLRSILKAQNNGLNVTRALILTDMNGFSVRQHACPACLAILIRWSIILESYYPKFTEEIIILNAPSYGAVFLNTILSFLSPETRNQFKVFDGNKKVWLQYLDARIDKTQRTSRYGGTKPEN